MALTTDQLRSQLPRHVDGLLVSSHSLIHRMDAAGAMTVDQFLTTPDAIEFRLQVHALTLWLQDAAAQDRCLSDAERQRLMQLIGDPS